MPVLNMNEARKKAWEKSHATQMKNQARKKKMFLEKFKEASGIQAYAVDACHISRAIVHKWRNDDEEFDEKYREIEETCIDRVEAKLLEQIMDGNITAIIFYLKTKGKKHGFVEQIDQNVNISPFEKLMKDLPEDPYDNE